MIQKKCINLHKDVLQVQPLHHKMFSFHMLLCSKYVGLLSKETLDC